MDGSGGQDMLSQQRMLQSYMDNLFGSQQNGNNTTNPGNGVGLVPGIQMPQQQQHQSQQQAMHPGVPAIFQNAQRYQANDGGNGQQQQQQPFQPNNGQQQQQIPWQQQISQQQAQQAQAAGQRPIFPATSSGSNQSGQMTQAEIQAMLTSLGQQSHTGSSSSSNNNAAGMPGNNTTPQPQFAMNQFLQQQHQQQTNPAAYNAQLQAAIQHMQQQQQQQQQGHMGTSTPPPPNNAAAQAAALLMAQQQQQQQAALANAANMNGGVANILQQQGGQIDPAILMKLRQSGMNLTPEQHVMLSTRMLRRGGIADGPQQQGGQQQQGQAQPPIQGSPQQQQQHLLQQQLQRQLPTASLPLGLSNMQPAAPNQGQQQQQPQNLFPQPPLPQQHQQQQQQSIPLNVLQEFTTISEQLRTYTTTEQHLAMCLAQNLHIPKQLNGNQNQQQQNQSPQPLTQQTRMQIEKTLEHTRRLLGNARETLARLEMEYGGKENIIHHLKAFAAQKHARQNQATQQQQQQVPPQPVQNQNQMQQQQQQQQQNAISMLVNRGQMRTPVNGMQAQQQQQQQPHPTPPQLHRQPTNPSQLTLQQQQQQSTPQQMQARVLATIGQSSTPVQNQQQQNNAQQGALMSPNPLSRNMSLAQQQGTSPSLGALGLPGTSNSVLPTQQNARPSIQQNPSSQSIPTTSNMPSIIPNTNNAAALAQHQQFLRNQAGHVNEEILKTLAAAGPSTFMKALFDTMLKRGTPIKNTPRVDGTEIDLVKLYRLVQQKGGCAVVRQSGLWRTIALEHGLNVDADSAQRISDQLSNVYTEFLEPFEEIQRKAAMANYQKHHIQQVQAQAAASRQQQQQQQQMHQQLNGQSQGQGQGIVRQPSPMQQVPQNGNAMPNQQFQQHTQSQQQYLQNMQHLQQQAQQQHAVNMQQQQQLQQQQPSNQTFLPPQQPQQQQQGLQIPAQPPDTKQSSPAMIMQHLPPTGQGQGHNRTMSQSSSNQQSMTPNMGQKPLQSGQKLNNLPTPEELERAKAEIQAMQAGIASKKAQYDPISMPDPAEQERFIAAAKNMAPMVDKVMDLLAVYLAISQQVEGSRRLLVMMSMFRDQLPLLEQRQFILRVSDLEKLKVQMQRCWSFVHSTAAGQYNQQNAAASAGENGQNNNSNQSTASNAQQQQPAGQQAQQPTTSAANTDPAAFSAALKAGIKIEDLKPPAPKHRRTNSSADTPNAAGTSPAVVAVTSGTGGTYASPIAVDSPSPAKTDNKPLSSLPTRKPSQTGNSPATSTKAVAGRKAKGKAGATPSSDTTGATPLMINSLQLAPASMQSSLPSEQQQASLKRKRELEDAQNDPVGFSKRIFASYLDTQNGPPRVEDSSDALTAELLSFLNEDMLLNDQPEQKVETSSSVTKASPSKDDQSISIFLADTPASNKWPYDSMSIAETPELGHLDDPTKTSPPDHDSVATPADSSINHLHPFSSSFSASTAATSSQNVSFSKALSAPSSSFTQNLLSSFDEEYDKMFGSSMATLAPAADPNAMNWNWEYGPVFPAKA